MEGNTEGHRKRRIEGQMEEYVEKDTHMEMIYARSGITHGGDLHIYAGHTMEGTQHGGDIDMEMTNRQLLIPRYAWPELQVHICGRKDTPAASPPLVRMSPSKRSRILQCIRPEIPIDITLALSLNCSAGSGILVDG